MIVLPPPKHNVQHLFAGLKYRTAAGFGLGSLWSDLQSAAPNMERKQDTLNKYWIYRPDQVSDTYSGMDSIGVENQKARKHLTCSASSSDLPNLRFYLASCASALSGGTVKAVLLGNPDNSDLQFEDPFVSLQAIPPCPTSRSTDAQALAKRGFEELQKNKMGDYHAMDSVKKATPILCDAALSGSRQAAGTYTSVLFNHIMIDGIGAPSTDQWIKVHRRLYSSCCSMYYGAKRSIQMNVLLLS